MTTSPDNLRQSERRSSSSSRTTSRGTISVLYVEPPGEVDETLEQLTDASDRTLEVTPVATADDALSTLREGWVDCVVTPQQLSDRSGIDLLVAIRDQYSDLPIVLFPRSGDEALASRAIAAGVTEYVPCDPDDRHDSLADRVIAAVDRFRSRNRDEVDYLRSLYEIASGTDRSFEEKVEDLLVLGCERFDVDIGMFTREHEQSFEIVQMHGTHPVLDEGTLTPPMTENYCRRVVSEGRPISVCDAGEAGWDGDALYDEFDLCCYAGAQVTADDERYGTVCFTDLSPRDEPFTDAERTFLELLGQCLSYELERERREDHLTALNDLTRELMDAETPDAVSEQAVESAASTLDLPVTAVALYDEQYGELDTAARTDAAGKLLDSTDLLGSDGTGWQAFIAGEARRVTDLPDRLDEVHPSITEVMVFPLDTYGVLVVGSTATDGFTPTDVDFAETVAANVRTVIDRTTHEQQLRERDRALEEQNETLERLNRINDIIRSIDQALVDASSRREIESVVCEQLADVGPYELAWVGERDGGSDEVVPREWSRSGEGYLDQITVTADDTATGNGPAGRAVKSREPQVTDDILTDEPFEPWRRAALDRGYHACLALPLIYDDSMYGILTVYAGQPGVFDDLEQEVLAELSDTIAYAINAVENKKALVSTAVTELTFHLRDDPGVTDFVARTGCEFTLESLVPQTDGPIRLFFSTRGASTDEVFDAAHLLSVEDVTLISAYEENGDQVGLFEARTTDTCLCETVLDHGGLIQQFTAADGEATLRVELSADAEVREFAEMFQTKYPASELVSQREHEQSRRTLTELSSLLREELTARQLEVLETAYHSGYFEEPRDRNASEIAESLGVTQPTFTHHLRVGHRKLCELLFEDGRSPNLQS